MSSLVVPDVIHGISPQDPQAALEGHCGMSGTRGERGEKIHQAPGNAIRRVPDFFSIRSDLR